MSPLMGLLWLGLAAFAIALAVLIGTRWGQYRPLRKCLLLSLLAHLLAAGYATTVQIVAHVPSIREAAIRVSFLGGPVGLGSGPGEPLQNEPYDEEVSDEPEQPGLTEAAEPTKEPAPAAAPQELVSKGLRRVAAEDRPIPETYKLRMAADHVHSATGGGGSPETEAAVQAALKWLTDNQNPDGRWEAKRHEAGRDTMADGQSRPQAGVEADTGMTGLALLALLASGHTHLRSPYQDNVRRGLEYLLGAQAPDGNLAGRADRFAAMYCHAMAAFALSEAYGMTGDQRLDAGVRRAVGYTVAAQDPFGGGWRYRPRDAGDTSQSGWQVMALKSAELAGIPIPERTRAGILRYLQSVASGRQGGLASYRPRERPSRAMTAEAMVCWQFLGMPRSHPAGSEAAGFLVGELPGEGTPNFYYWYYATLATYQLQGDAWRQWNDAMRTHLLVSQRQAPPLSGSWDPDPIWGGYGGRVFSTSLGALCLEVYYRYLPVYVQAGREEFGRTRN